MASWQSDLIDIFEGPLDDAHLTEAVLNRLVETRQTETSQLDFKRTYTKEPGEAHEFAKDVAALANSIGGMLLIGIDEERGTGVARAISARREEKSDAFRRRLTQSLRNHCAPTPHVEMIEIPTPQTGGSVIAVIMPPSPWAPHAVSLQSRSSERMCYPERIDTATRYLNEHEIADRYRRRLSLGQGSADRLRHVVSEGQRAVDRAMQGIWVYLALVPERSLLNASMTAADLKDATEWFSQPRFGTRLAGHPYGSVAAYAAPGRSCLTAVSDEGGRVAGARGRHWSEFYVDGSAFVAIRVASHLPDQTADGARIILLDTLVGAVIELTDLATSWAARRSGAYGSAIAAVGLMQPDVVVSTMLHQVVKLDGVQEERHPHARDIQLPVQTSCAFDLAEIESPQGRIAAAYTAGSALVQWFGLPEIEHLTPNGGVRLAVWSPQHWDSLQLMAAKYSIALGPAL